MVRPPQQLMLGKPRHRFGEPGQYVGICSGNGGLPARTKVAILSTNLRKKLLLCDKSTGKAQSGRPERQVVTNNNAWRKDLLINTRAEHANNLRNRKRNCCDCPGSKHSIMY